MIHDRWYKNAVIYNLHVGTFMDGDGDGIGDIEGLRGRLDHLQWLGIDTLWIAPIQPSADCDGGYDISDYYAVDPRYGSLGQFVEFVRRAQELGIRVILDLVVNHTSVQHPWFQHARSATNSPYRDWYVWSKKRPTDWNKGMVFPGVQRSIWTRDEVARQYYRHRFYECQPDLNTANPAVRAEILRIMGFWLQLGVDGFRLDAVPFIIESKGPGCRGLHCEYINEMRDFLQARHVQAILLGEANVIPSHNPRYFADGRRGLHMMFNFHVNQHLFCALANEQAAPLKESLLATREIPAMTQWAMFLRNHDELDLGRLPKALSKAVFERFGPDPQMQIYQRGIRRRLASMLADRSHLELAYSLLLSLPGTPVLHYGDEIGMGDDLSLAERNAVRTLMQWNSDRNAGFSESKSVRQPLVCSGPCDYRRVNVQMQRRDPHSLLNWMARMIHLRKRCSEIGSGRWRLLQTGSPSVLAMCYSLGNKRLLTIHNFSHQPQRVQLRFSSGRRLVSLLNRERRDAGKGGRHCLALEGWDYRWYRLCG